MGDIQTEIIKQCQYYNTLVTEGAIPMHNELKRVDHHDVIKGICKFEKHVPYVSMLQGLRVSLDLAKFDQLRCKERRGDYESDEEWDEDGDGGKQTGETSDMRGVVPDSVCLVIPGRGATKSVGVRVGKTSLGRGQLVKALLAQRAT